MTLGESLEITEAAEFLHAARAAAASGRSVFVDCSAPEFLPTFTIQILASLQRSCRESGVSFALEGVRDSSAAYLRLAGLESIQDR